MQPPTPFPNRARGAFLGLAVGDALGTTLEFHAPGSFTPIRDMLGGGPFRLPPGAWTDDTSMAACLAESLITCGGMDAHDQLRRFLAWYREGYWSSTGACFDIGTATRMSLERYELQGDPDAGSENPEDAGNGALMRLAPVVICFAHDAPTAVAHAVTSARTTHQAPTTLDANRVFAALLVRALQGEERGRLLSDQSSAAPLWGTALHPEIAAVAAGSYLHKEPPAIIGSGYVVRSLEAALWAVASTDSFPAAVLAAANLGDDADTTAAIAGQLAGAIYGAAGIPERWLARLARRTALEGLVEGMLRLAERHQASSP